MIYRMLQLKKNKLRNRWTNRRHEFLEERGHSTA